MLVGESGGTSVHGSIAMERRVPVNLDVRVGSLLYNVWGPQYNPEFLQVCAVFKD